MCCSFEAAQLLLKYNSFNRTIILCPVLGFPLCPKSKGLWLIVWWIERKWHLFNFILWTCTCSSSVFFCQPEETFCVRMNCVSSALSAVSFAFPQSPSSKGSMLDDTGKREKACSVGMRLVSDIYLNVLLPIGSSLLKTCSGSFVQVELEFLFRGNFSIIELRDDVQSKQEAGLKPHFKCR